MDDDKPVAGSDDIPPGLFMDYCAKVDALAERERQRMARYCNFCGAMTDEGCELCARAGQ
jgi:hypothetical protein